MIRRLGQAVITICLLAVMIFLITRLTGDPVSLMAAEQAMADRIRLTERLGLDQPLYVQFGNYVADLLRGDLGTSFRFGEPVTEVIFGRLVNSLMMVVPAFVVAIVIGLPLGVIAARGRRKLTGRLSSIVAVLGVATPNFWLGLVLIFVFAGALGWLPSSRMGGPSHYVLPVITLASAFIAGIMRLVRSSMLEEMSTEYVKLARTKGTSERRVVWHHALRNSLLPAVAFIGASFSGFVTGAISVETVFAWPGVGRLLFDSSVQRDFPVVQGIIIVGGVMIIAVTLITDLITAWLDPRIQ